MSRDKEEERDERIRNEVIVDAYTVDEQAISWCYYLERKMSFPFQARCIQERTISPLIVISASLYRRDYPCRDRIR
jgi:hypothetical protein